ncbi:MAG: ABC transporter permease [Armatimonadota bacterium]|nr:ABC transporter permease [Armatimonadota bacterium]MDR7454672.1 ABC transporter permease [Armatimonadota bacterium]MDR7456592.1 ABC transporter permease [Armatimonadota bacterium]MDR7497717.1 ABC transporter permease [Armatimonadota bacterium]MDR7510698.1 ABC transporter permease [Armatimonadota bacterium]
MSHYVLRRVGLALPTLFGVTLVIFLMVRLIPGDPARIIAGVQASDEEVTRIRRELGVDRPIAVQYARFLSRLLQGDLGLSAVTRAPVLEEIGLRLRPTGLLAFSSTVVATAVGLAAGVVSATRQYSILDYLVMTVALCGVSIPVFWLGIMLMLVFSVYLHWLPAGGYGGAAHFVLPTLTLAAFSIAIIARMTRSSLLETFNQDYVRTARAKGVRRPAVILRHALKNALIPIITVVGLQFGALLGGAILTETTFAWPGMGRLLVNAITARDYPVIQGVVLTFAVVFTVVNLAVDLLYAYVDPRIHYG